MKQRIVDSLNILIMIALSVFIISAPFSKAAVKIACVIVLICSIIVSRLDNAFSVSRKFIARTPVDKPLMFFLLAMVFACIFSLDASYSYSVLFERYLGYALFFCFGRRVVTYRRNVPILIGMILAGSILLGAGGLWDYFFLQPARLFTSFGHQASLARFFTMQIPLSYVILAFSRNRVLKTASLISLVLITPCLIFEAARGAWVAVGIAILTVSFLRDKKKAVVLMLLSGCVFLFLPTHIKQRAITTFDPFRWGERMALWKMGFRMFANYPLLGIGPGMQEKLFTEYWQPVWPYIQMQCWHVHNNYLEIAAESGVVGLSAFIYLIIIFFKNACGHLKTLAGEDLVLFSGLLYSVAAAFILALSVSNITVGVQEVAVFWFIFGMTSGLMGRGSLK